MIGLIAIACMGALNLTWDAWLPSVRLYPDLPLSWLPDSFDALRVGLTLVVATSLTVGIWVALRLALPPKPKAGLAGEGTTEGRAG